MASPPTQQGVFHTLHVGEEVSGPPVARLVVSFGATLPSLTGQTFPLSASPVSIGRESVNDIVVPESSVSGRHALLERRGDAWWCTDLGSRNGTYVNDVPLTQPVQLRSGDKIRLGRVMMHALSDEQGDALSGAVRPLPGLPFPLEMPWRLVRAQTSNLGRVHALLAALETGLAFVAACQLAYGRERGDETMVDGVAHALKTLDLRRNLTFGGWAALVFELSKRLSRGTHPIAMASRAFVDERGRATDLCASLQSAIGFRNREFAHARPQPDGVYAASVEELEATTRFFLHDLAPLAQCPLVSVAEVEIPDDDEEGYIFKLRMHMGPSEHFEVQELRSEARMIKRWCYLMVPGEAPLSLSPLVAACVPEGEKRLEVALASRIVLGPAKTETQVSGIVSNAKVGVPIAWSSTVAALFSRF